MGDFRVTSFNLYNLNLPGLPMYRGKAWTLPEFERKRDWTAFMLRVAGAEVFGFQELWHPDALRQAVTQAGLAGSHTLLAPPGLSGQRIDNAALVRTDLLADEPEWITGFPEELVLRSRGDDPQTAEISVQITAFSRPVLRFAIRPAPGQAAIQVFVCHFKSKGPTQVEAEPWFRADRDRYKDHSGAIGAAISTIRRTAEAAALRVILTGWMKRTDTPVLVLGDLNDDHNSNTLDILTEQPNFLAPLATGGGDTALYSGQSLQQYLSQRDVYYTYIHKRIHGSLDHILASQEFYANSRKRVWTFTRLDIYNDHLNDEGHKLNDGTGDHGLVRAHFKLQPAHRSPSA
jgi:predicted extracellular nuclease